MGISKHQSPVREGPVNDERTHSERAVSDDGGTNQPAPLLELR